MYCVYQKAPETYIPLQHRDIIRYLYIHTYILLHTRPKPHPLRSIDKHLPFFPSSFPSYNHHRISGERECSECLRDSDAYIAGAVVICEAIFRNIPDRMAYLRDIHWLGPLRPRNTGYYAEIRHLCCGGVPRYHNVRAWICDRPCK